MQVNQEPRARFRTAINPPPRAELKSAAAGALPTAPTTGSRLGPASKRSRQTPAGQTHNWLGGSTSHQRSPSWSKATKQPEIPCYVVEAARQKRTGKTRTATGRKVGESEQKTSPRAPTAEPEQVNPLRSRERSAADGQSQRPE